MKSLSIYWFYRSIIEEFIDFIDQWSEEFIDLLILSINDRKSLSIYWFYRSMIGRVYRFYLNVLLRTIIDYYQLVYRFADDVISRLSIYRWLIDIIYQSIIIDYLDRSIGTWTQSIPYWSVENIFPSWSFGPFGRGKRFEIDRFDRQLPSTMQSFLSTKVSVLYFWIYDTVFDESLIVSDNTVHYYSQGAAQIYTLLEKSARRAQRYNMAVHLHT